MPSTSRFGLQPAASELTSMSKSICGRSGKTAWSVSRLAATPGWAPLVRPGQRVHCRSTSTRPVETRSAFTPSPRRRRWARPPVAAVNARRHWETWTNTIAPNTTRAGATLALESVLHLVASLLQTALRLLGSAFGLQILVIGGITDGLLALKFLRLVIGLSSITISASTAIPCSMAHPPENDKLIWPHCAGLIWPHPGSVRCWRLLSWLVCW